MATVAKSMPQFGLLMMLVLIPLQMLSGGMTPRESMPSLVQNIMQIAPTTHFVNLAQAVLYRDAGFGTVLGDGAVIKKLVMNLTHYKNRGRGYAEVSIREPTDPRKFAITCQN